MYGGRGAGRSFDGMYGDRGFREKVRKGATDHVRIGRNHSC